MDVSILIVNWNTRELLRRCLQSLARGVGAVDAQVMVVDNGSADGSAEVAAGEFPHIDVLRNRDNLGFARANNQAYRNARGRYVLLLNPDTELRGGAVEQMVRFLDADQRRAGATALLRNPDGTLQRYHKRLPRWRHLLLTETVLRNLFPHHRWARELYMLDASCQAVIEIEQPPAACLMLRRSVLEEGDLFDERFPIFYNDVDLCRRLHDRGHRLYLVPTAEVMHDGGAGGVGRLPDRGTADCLIGLLRYYRKHEGRYRAALVWLVLTVNSVLVLFGGFVKVLGGRRSLAWWSGEAAKRARVALGRESFRYPEDRTTPTEVCAIPCRH